MFNKNKQESVMLNQMWARTVSYVEAQIDNINAQLMPFLGEMEEKDIETIFRFASHRDWEEIKSYYINKISAKTFFKRQAAETVDTILKGIYRYDEKKNKIVLPALTCAAPDSRFLPYIKLVENENLERNVIVDDPKKPLRPYTSFEPKFTLSFDANGCRDIFIHELTDIEKNTLNVCQKVCDIMNDVNKDSSKYSISFINANTFKSFLYRDHETGLWCCNTELLCRQ